MSNVRTMPTIYERRSKSVIHRAQSSTPIKPSGIANLGYSKTQQARLHNILKEM